MPADLSSARRERIAGAEPRKPREIPIHRPQFLHTVFTDQRGDMRIVDQVAHRSSTFDGAPEMAWVCRAFAQQHQRGRRKQRFQIFQGGVEIRGRVEDPRVGDHPQKLIYTRPGQSPQVTALGETLKERKRRGMLR